MTLDNYRELFEVVYEKTIEAAAKEVDDCPDFIILL